ncbi:hypothetical protein B0H16DRAFT_1792742 [Mycena metata]|uniref:Uncharacterized protein n=1 Tax=Mycena metata TaxID=1033252 RepID=A0AAD7HH80_9AGAR|nr:hypothetical protein B0H16DRAFT_1792742 [Mycena metata]
MRVVLHRRVLVNKVGFSSCCCSKPVVAYYGPDPNSTKEFALVFGSIKGGFGWVVCLFSQVRRQAHIAVSAAAPTPAASNLNPTFAFSTFHCNPPAPTQHAVTQSQYRARNAEAERERGRQRMRRLRESRRARAASSERLRSTPEFARYRVHVERHRGAVYGWYDTDPAYHAAYDRFRFRQAPHEFNREDALFLLHHATPQPPEQVMEEEIELCLAQLNRCTLVLEFDWDDPDAAAGWAALEEHRGGVLTDDDIEFMFRHAVPPPTMANMDACGLCPGTR